MDIAAKVQENKCAILEAAQRHRASNVRVIGSIARGEGSEASDLDLLVSFSPDASLFDHAALVNELEDLLGCSVDIASDTGLRPRVRDRVLKEAVGL